MKCDNSYVALHLYCGSSSFGGAERRLLRAYGEVAKKIPVDLIVREGQGGMFEEACAKANVSTESFCRLWKYSSKHHLLADAKAVLRCFDSRYTNHVIFDYSRFNHILTIFNKYVIKSKIIYTSADYRYMAADKYSVLNIKPRKFESMVKKVDWVDTLYPAQREYYAEITDVDVTITPGTFTDLEMFKPGKKERIISFLSARFDECKNPALLIDAVEICQNQLKDYGYKVFLCGTGTRAASLGDEIGRRGLDDLIIMPGYVEPSTLLPKTEVVCLLGEEENYPSQVIAEGSASGCYVLATDVGSTDRVVRPEFGALVKCSAESVSEALVEYIKKSDVEKRDIIGASRRFAVCHFDIKKTADYFSDIIRRVNCNDCAV